MSLHIGLPRLQARPFLLCVNKVTSQLFAIFSLVTSNELLYFISMSFFLLKFCSGRDVKAQKEKYLPDYYVYHNLSTLTREISQIALDNPDFIKIQKQYQSRNKLSQLVLHITDFNGRISNDMTKLAGNYRLKILFSYGVHAREFLPVESLLYLLKNLTNGLKTSPGSLEQNFSEFVLSNTDIYIISMANPDGRKLIESTKNYCWRGTKTGVDLDRNFGWEYGGYGSSSDPRDEEYRGRKKFSEPECAPFVDLTEKVQFDLFISFHSGIKHIYIPYADTKSKKTKRRPDNVDDMINLAEQLSHSTKYSYRYGEAHNLNDYTADGTIFDYMAGAREIPFSYTIELWGQKHNGQSCFDLFNPPNEKLQEVLETIHPMYVKLFYYMIDWKSEHLRYINRRDSYTEAPSNIWIYTYIHHSISDCYFLLNWEIQNKYREKDS